MIFNACYSSTLNSKPIFLTWKYKRNGNGVHQTWKLRISSWNVLILFRDNPDIQHFLSSASWECGNYKSMECIKHRGLRGVCCTSSNSLTLRSHIALIPGSVWKVVSNYDYLRERPGSQVKRTHWWWKNKMALWEKIITCFLLHILPNNILFEKKNSKHLWTQRIILKTEITAPNHQKKTSNMANLFSMWAAWHRCNPRKQWWLNNRNPVVGSARSNWMPSIS